jgi:hypothetical protein
MPVLLIIIFYFFREFLTSEGSSEINVNEQTRNRIVKIIGGNPTRDSFAEAEHHIYELMKKNVYPRYLQSEIYKSMLDKAPIPSNKKK